MRKLYFKILFFSLLVASCKSKLEAENVSFEDKNKSEEEATSEEKPSGIDESAQVERPIVPDYLKNLKIPEWMNSEVEAPTLQIDGPIEGVEVRIVNSSGQVIADWAQVNKSYDVVFEDSKTYTYEIRTIDADGNYSDIVLGPSWTVDIVSPSLVEFMKPSAIEMTVDSNYLFSWNSSDAGSEIVTFEYKIFQSIGCSAANLHEK